MFEDIKLVDVKLGPPPVIKQDSNIAVVMVIGSETNETEFMITGEPARRYAVACGADFHALRVDSDPSFPVGSKYNFCHYLAKYDRTLCLDCDVLIRHDAPNIFEQMPVDRICVVDEFAHTTANGRDTKWWQVSADMICDSQKAHPYEQRWMCNAGVMLIPQKYAYYYDPPRYPIPNFWWAEQQWFSMQIEGKDCVHEMNHRWNWSHLRKDFFNGYRDAYFWHLCDCKPHSRRLDILYKLFHYDLITYAMERLDNVLSAVK